MRISVFALGAALVSQSSLILAADEADTADKGPILVTASRADEPQSADRYAGSASVLSADDLATRQTRNLADALRDVPGVAVSEVAGQTQLRLRGSEGNHVLVLIDGIEVSDPFAGEFDIGALQAEIGARVEVLRGAQSALYGSDAIGGVVAYQSASACEGAPLSAYAEGGSFATFNAAAHAGLCGDAHELALGATLVSTDGSPNARRQSFGGGTRDIGRDSVTLSTKGSADLAPDLVLRAVGRYVSTEGDFNDQDFNPASPTMGLVIDSPGVRFTNDAFYALAGLNLAASPDWRHDLSAQIADITRDSFADDQRTFGSKGQRLKSSYVSSLNFAGPVFAHRLTFAADWERESFRNTDPSGFAFTGRRRTRNIGLVGEYALEGEGFDLSAAIRRDFNDRFADATTLRVAGGVDVGPATRLRASYGSGIKNPGFYELYGFVDGRFIGNEDLKPEKSTGWEAGIDHSLAGGAARISATWFESDLEDEIFTAFPPPDFIPSPANRLTKSMRKGLELSVQAKIGPQLSLDAAYTWLDAKEDGVDEVRRPASIASAMLTWTAPGNAASASLIVRHNGASDDFAFTDPGFVPLIVRLDDYTLVNFNARIRLSGKVELFARVENLLDERYEPVFSFVAQGRSAIAGISITP